MTRRPGLDRVRTTVVVIAAAIVIVAFGVLQYRWNRDASDATGVRLADSLQLSMINWHLDLLNNLSEIGVMLRAGTNAPAGAATESLAQRFGEWRAIARYPELVSQVYAVWPRREGRSEAHRLNPDTSTFEPVTWPAALGTLDAELLALPLEPADPLADAASGREAAEHFYSLGSVLRGWRFDPTIPALVRPASARASDISDRGTRWLVVVLDADVLEHRLLPDLAHRYFQGADGLDYEVAVVGGTPRRVIYTSDPGFGAESVDGADGRLDIFGRPIQRDRQSALRILQPTSDRLRPTATADINWFPLIRNSPTDHDWQLVLRHRRDGSLNAFVGNIRTRGLIVSYSALALLVVAVSMLIVTSVRAQRLARLQMNFVTAVSHELRTPLTIIGSAADNIAAGVVDTREQLREYGTVIGNEVGQLSGLVERILQFAAMRDGRQRYSMRALDVGDVIDAVLASTGGLIRAGQFTVERDIAPNLPAVTADDVAIAQCLENLVTNALKYGKQERWLGIRARAIVDDSGRTDVQISVADRGIGIEPGDLTHIFEPFYRSASVRAAQIHGTGIGLALARQIADAMGGSIDVASVPGRGSTFTLHLFTDPVPQA